VEKGWGVVTQGTGEEKGIGSENHRRELMKKKRRSKKKKKKKK